VGNVYIILKKIYCGNGVSNLIRIARVLWKILLKTFWPLFFWPHCSSAVGDVLANQSVFTALHVMQTRYCDENSVRPSVCLSVCLSHACIVTKQ